MFTPTTIIHHISSLYHTYHFYFLVATTTSSQHHPITTIKTQNNLHHLHVQNPFSKRGWVRKQRERTKRILLPRQLLILIFNFSTPVTYLNIQFLGSKIIWSLLKFGCSSPHKQIFNLLNYQNKINIYIILGG